jgi:hypothetical protein
MEGVEGEETMSSNPAVILPELTPQNAIEMQMQFQVEMMKLVNEIALSLRSIAINLEKIGNKQS